MYTNNECLEAVRQRKTLSQVYEEDFIIGEINREIVNRVNTGWLALNLDFIPDSRKYLRLIEDYYTELGFIVTDGMIFWMYDSNKQKRLR